MPGTWEWECQGLQCRSLSHSREMMLLFLSVSCLLVALCFNPLVSFCPDGEGLRGEKLACRPVTGGKWAVRAEGVVSWPIGCWENKIAKIRWCAEEGGYLVAGPTGCGAQEPGTSICSVLPGLCLFRAARAVSVPSCRHKGRLEHTEWACGLGLMPSWAPPSWPHWI